MESNRGAARTPVQPPPSLTSAKSAADLQSDPTNSYISTLTSKNFEKYEVIVENEQLEGELRCIEWRSKTEFPVVKVLFYKMLQKKLLGECSVVQVAIENFPSNLHSLPPLSLPHILYLLKEALIGFERLLDRFGSFEPSPRMVLVNKNGKCRVWMNENITLNFPSRRARLTQGQFLARAIHFFEQKCVKTSGSMDFFGRIGMTHRFLQALQILEAFIKNNKIALPSKLNLVQQSTSPKKNAQKLETIIDKNDEIFGCGSLKKIPKFVMQLREERKQEDKIDSKSFDSPVKKQAKRDRSFARTVINALKHKQKSELQSECKSNVSPLSQVSQDNKETKSNNEKPLAKERSMRPAVRELLKQNSHQAINTYATMHPISPHHYPKTDKQLPTNADLTLTKIPHNTPVKKARKLSSEESPSKKQKYGMVAKPVKTPPPAIKEQCSVQSSQQTAATVNESTIRPKLTRLIEKSPEMPAANRAFEEQEQTTIYQRNGWLKRVDTLTSDKLRDTIQSEYEGQETFSEDYLLAGEQLGALGSMGRQLKGSITGP